MEKLSANELSSLIRSVFSPGTADKTLTILVDVPDQKVKDEIRWKQRRTMAKDWQKKLDAVKTEIGLTQVQLVYYPNVHSNNADLPDNLFLHYGAEENITATELAKDGKKISLTEMLQQTQMILAPTQFSATAPLMLLAKKYNFRAATMPGFTAEMIPALKLDYAEINRRVWEIKKMLDPAVAVDIAFSTATGEHYTIHFDLRFRQAHASGGRLPNVGSAGNLPSGECYIVPYEGELEAVSESEGILPVQFDQEIVLYKIQQNVARTILSQGKYSALEQQKIIAEPAYANIAEIGFGVLKDFGVKPCGEILLDEKLGLHIAFGRSDHFGGRIGVADFSSPDKVIHIDRIYIPETQNQIAVNKVTLDFADGKKITLMENGNYTIF